MISGNLFESIPKDLNQEQIQQIVQSEQVCIERIISRGQSSPESGWYDQEQNEWVMVLSGGAELLFEGAGTVRLNPGDYFDIPAHTKHRVSWTDPDIETIWLAVHYC